MQSLRQAVKKPWRMINIVKEIRHLSSNRVIHFSHMKRSANSVADFLAKVGVYKNVLVVEFFV